MPSILIPCVASSVMGDINATDFATKAHSALLRRGGALPDHRRATAHKPYPRGAAMHAVAVDDRAAAVSIEASAALAWDRARASGRAPDSREEWAGPQEEIRHAVHVSGRTSRRLQESECE